MWVREGHLLTKGFKRSDKLGHGTNVSSMGHSPTEECKSEDTERMQASKGYSPPKESRGKEELEDEKNISEW